VGELNRADEVWITSSTKEILPVTRLDGEPVGDGQPGPLFRTVLAGYREHLHHLGRGTPEDTP